MVVDDTEEDSYAGAVETIERKVGASDRVGRDRLISSRRAESDRRARRIDAPLFGPIVSSS
jgi:hypothetical protein